MTRETAMAAVRAIEDIDDFEILYDEIDFACKQSEGNFTEFFKNKLYPLLNAERGRLQKVLDDM